MKRVLALAAALPAVLGISDYVRQNVRNNIGDDKLISFKIQDFNTARELLTEHEIDELGMHEGMLHLRLSQDAVATLAAGGIKFNDETEENIRLMEETLNMQDVFCTAGSVEACAALPADEYYATYQVLESLHARLDLIAAGSDVATVGSIGSSYEGRDLKIINVGDQSKPLVFFTCNIHAREWIPPIFCTYLAETLAAGHPLLDNFSFTILVSQNPDGYVYSYTTDNSWRRTRKPNPYNAQCPGTDGNRNYDSFWAGEGTSPNPCDQTYHGHAPFDNPETAAIRDFSNQPDIASRLISFIDVHSYGSYWLFPWSGIFELPPEDDLEKMMACTQAAHDAIIEVNGEDYTIGPSADTLYVAAGVSDDYFYEKLGVTYAYTIEHRGGGLSGLAGFQPPPFNIMLANLEVMAGIESYYQCVYDFELNPNPPTAAPTPCVDMDPNGIVYADGSDAPCDELADYCDVYSFVQERCPVTCDSCDAQTASTRARLMNRKSLPVAVIESATVASSSVALYVGAAVGSVALVAVIAGVAYKVKKDQN